jgi:hypothetical protein
MGIGNSTVMKREDILYDNANEQEKAEVDEYIEDKLKKLIANTKFSFKYYFFRGKTDYDIFVSSTNRDIYVKIDQILEKLKNLTDLSFVVQTINWESIIIMNEINYISDGYYYVMFLQDIKKERNDIYFDDVSQLEKDIIKKMVLDTNLSDLYLRKYVVHKEDDKRHFIVYYENNKSIYLLFEKFMEILSLNPDYEFISQFNKIDKFDVNTIHKNGFHYNSPGFYLIKVKKIA